MRLLEAGKARKQIKSARTTRRKSLLWLSSFGEFDLQKYKIINLCCLKPLSFWLFVREAIEN